MHSRHDPRTSALASIHANTARDLTAPRPRRLLVEVYAAQAPQPRRPQRKAPRRAAAMQRALIVTLVLALHTVVFAWVLVEQPSDARPYWSPPPLILMTLTAPPEKTTLVQLAALTAPTKLLRLPRVHPAALAELKIPDRPPAEELISYVDAAEVFNVALRCAAPRDRANRQVRAVAITLLVRVEPDGQVSDSEIDVDNGAHAIAEAAQRCLLAHGHFAPRRVSGGKAVSSWQRVRWPADML